MPRKKTTEEFIIEAKVIHGDKYDYKDSEYNGRDAKVKIICPIHGEFWQTPHNHVNGKQGCPRCKYEKLSKDERISKEEFIRRAKKIHNGKYTYIGEYVNNRTEITIKCPIHGEFSQTPHSHLRGHGCPKCSHNYKITTDSFIEKSKLIHENKYDYSKVEYKNSHSKVKIICPIHGEFEQVAYYHLQGAGCPKCNESHLEKEIRRILEDKKIKFIPQCGKNVIPWIDKQKLDFYLPDYNVAIECQGEQHYINKNGIFEDLEKNIERDISKYNKCIENNVKLMYFSHKHLKKYHTFGNFYCDKNKLLNDITSNGTE